MLILGFKTAPVAQKYARGWQPPTFASLLETITTLPVLQNLIWDGGEWRYRVSEQTGMHMHRTDRRRPERKKRRCGAKI
jgi:hypothetical protein